jgi:ABC-2 type transport system permease protein
MRQFLNIVMLDLKNMFKNPVLVGYNTIFSGLVVLIMGYLASGSYMDSRNGYQYYMVSFTVFGMLNGAMTASNCFMERDIKRPNLRIIFSPVGNFQIYFSKIVASFLFDYVLHVMMLGVLCFALDLTLGSQPLYFLLLMFPIEFAFSALGIFFCCIYHCEETTSTLLSTVISLLCILGGTFFSLDSLGKIASGISALSPVKWLNEAFILISYDNNIRLFWPVFIGASLISILLSLGCSKFFRTEDYL